MEFLPCGVSSWSWSSPCYPPSLPQEECSQPWLTCQEGRVRPWGGLTRACSRGCGGAAGVLKTHSPPLSPCPGLPWTHFHSALACPGHTFTLPWSALVCPGLPWSALVCPGPWRHSNKAIKQDSIHTSTHSSHKPAGTVASDKAKVQHCSNISQIHSATYSPLATWVLLFLFSQSSECL